MQSSTNGTAKAPAAVPVTPKKEGTADIKKPASSPHKGCSSPLVLSQKQKMIEEIKKTDEATLKNILLQAALNDCVIPYPENQDLIELQSQYRKHKNRAAGPGLNTAITEYIEKEGIQHFQSFLKQPVKPENESKWNDKFLKFVMQESDVKIEEEPVVEATIQDGKILWRIMKGDICVNERHKFKAPPERTWRMSWPLFRIFKDSGKRGSNVKITRELFVRRFSEMNAEHKMHAPAIYAQLKSEGILNARDRLSYGWRALSKKYVTLVKDNDLKYDCIVKTLDKICEQDAKEKIKDIDGAYIHRVERTPKGWSSTGQILNAAPTTEANRTIVWDVSIYDDLTKHSQKNDGLQNDHIPSQAILNDKLKETEAYKKCKEYEEKIASIEAKLKLLNQQQEQKKDSTIQEQQGVTTRTQTNTSSTDEKFKNQCKSYNDEISQYQKERDEIKLDDIEGANWWAVAVPNGLHKASESYKAKLEDQKASNEHPFLTNVKVYLKILENPSLSKEITRGFFDGCKDLLDTYIKALGAFRYLYRCQVKPPTNVKGHYAIGSIPQLLFSQDARKKIDDLFLEKMQTLMKKREGENTPVNRKIDFQ